MLHPITPNETAAAVTSSGDLDFVLTTLSPTPGKGEDHGLIRSRNAHVQSHPPR